MRALYGEGLHPNADRIENYVAGRGVDAQRAAHRLGRKFLVRDGEPEFARRLAVAYRDHNAEAGAHFILASHDQPADIAGLQIAWGAYQRAAASRAASV